MAVTGTHLRLGSAAADITPDWPVSLAGFAVRTGPSRGVSHPLRVRLCVLESRDAEGTVRRAVVAVADVIWWPPHLVPLLRQRIAAATGAPEECVLLSATHTHSGPQTSRRASATIGVLDDRFIDLLVTRTVAAASDAATRLEPVMVSRSTGTHRLGFNRRLPRNPDGPEDPTLTVLRFDRTGGAPAALFVHYACHPVTTQDPYLSSEFCGVAMDRLEARLETRALYLQGCCGDINPDLLGERRIVRGPNAEVERLGTALAGAVEALLATSTPLPHEPIAIGSEQLVVDLPYAALPSREELVERAALAGVEGEAARAMLDHPEWLAPSIPLHLQRLDVARGCSLLAMDGEIVVEYGLRGRAASDGAVVPMGYANGMTGYVPTARIIAEGGYEAGDARPYFFLPAPFDADVEALMDDAIGQLARGAPR